MLRDNIQIYEYIQQDATLHIFILSGNCSKCFEWYHHPSSGAQTTVSTASGICHTVTATCRDAAGSSNDVTNTRCCRFSCLRSWWWVVVPLETCRAVSRYNKLCKVASCSIYVGLPKISENLNTPRKPLALRTWAARCLFLYLSTSSLATGFFVSARVSEFWLFSLHHCHECCVYRNGGS